MQPGVSLFGCLSGWRHGGRGGGGGSLNLVLWKPRLCAHCLKTRLGLQVEQQKKMETRYVCAHGFFFCLAVFRQCLHKKLSVAAEEEDGGRGRGRGGREGEGQTKRQIVGSLDMSRSLHQTKKTHLSVPRCAIAPPDQHARLAGSPRRATGAFAGRYYELCGAWFVGA